jgi:hypothetical protein
MWFCVYAIFTDTLSVFTVYKKWVPPWMRYAKRKGKRWMN